MASLSSADGRPMGAHPAATPAATIPAMTVGAPRAELERDRVDRVDRERCCEMGVATREGKLSSRPCVSDEALKELDRE